jgi:hypothetical protein
VSVSYISGRNQQGVNLMKTSMIPLAVGCIRISILACNIFTSN